MNRTVAIFASDVIRGNIVARKLKREGLEPLLHHSAPEAVRAVQRHIPRVFIFDTAGAIPEELRLVARCCDKLAGRAWLLCLGDAAAELTGLGLAPGCTFLSDPLDPEHIAGLVQDACDAPLPHMPEKASEFDLAPVSDALIDLEAELKEFLGLERR